MLRSFIARSGLIASGAVGFPHIANAAVHSGSVGSGQIASGHMDPNFIANIGGGSLTSGSVTSGFLGNASVLSGNIASGIIASGMMASGFINALGAATILSGQITTNQFASGTTVPFSQGVIQYLSGGIGNANTVITQQTISGICAVSLSQSGHLQIAMASVSGTMPAVGVVFDNVASGIQANVYSDGNFQNTLFSYSGYVGSLLYVGRSGQVVSSSGSYNSGGLQSGDLYQPIGWIPNGSGVSLSVTAQLAIIPGLISSGEIASGAIGWPLIADGGVQSGNIASGIISSGMLASGLLANIAGGSVTSGAVGTIDFASGAIAPFAQGLANWVSGFSNISAITQETISGVCAVSLSQSGHLQIAMASVSGRMPCVGVVFENVSSGIQATVWNDGTFQVATTVANYSGYVGQQLFVGRSGQVVTSSGSYNSGGLQSGDINQYIGYVVNSGTMSLSITSQPPFVPGQVTSGQIASGQIATNHLSSGTIAPAANGLVFSVFSAAEMLSGSCPVAIASGNFLWRAQGGTAARMPAIGIAIDNYASGTANVSIITNGLLNLTSGLYRLWSGSYGTSIWVSTSGDLMTTTKPTTATLSQIIGSAVSGGLFVNPSPICFSGNAGFQSGSVI